MDFLHHHSFTGGVIEKHLHFSYYFKLLCQIFPLLHAVLSLYTLFISYILPNSYISQVNIVYCPERFIRSLGRGIETAMMHSVETKLTIPYFSVLIVPRLSIDLLWFPSRILGEEIGIMHWCVLCHRF